MEGKSLLYGSLIFSVGILLFFVNLGTMTVDIMEARNFVTVREMLQSGDWLHPTMNGILRLEKPPFPTWITAIFASTFGLKSLFFLRLPAALAALWMLFSMNSLVNRLTNNCLLGMLSAMVLSGMLYVILLGRRGTWDIYTHSFMLAAIVQFIAMLQSVKPLRRGILGGLFFGIAFLSKGPVSAYALFIPFLIAYLWYYKPLLGRDKRPALFYYILISVLVSTSWFIFIQIVLGSESNKVISKEMYNWGAYNVRPWWYYLKDYPIHSGVWAAILMMGLFTTYTFNRSKDKKIFSFFWIWTILSIMLLSIVPEKKVRYLLPTFIPAAFLVASYLRFLIQDFDKVRTKFDSFIFKIHWGIFLLAALGLPITVYLLFYEQGIISLKEMSGVVFASLLCLYWIFLSKKNYKKHLLPIGILGLLATAVIFVLPHTDNVANKKFHSIAAVAEMEGLQELPCYALEETRIELVWLVGQKIKKVQTINDLRPPYLLLTNRPPEQTLENIDFQLIGHYDNNSKAKGHKHYEQGLTKFVSIIR